MAGRTRRRLRVALATTVVAAGLVMAGPSTTAACSAAPVPFQRIVEDADDLPRDGRPAVDGREHPRDLLAGRARGAAWRPARWDRPSRPTSASSPRSSMPVATSSTRASRPTSSWRWMSRRSRAASPSPSPGACYRTAPWRAGTTTVRRPGATWMPCARHSEASRSRHPVRPGRPSRCPHRMGRRWPRSDSSPGSSSGSRRVCSSSSAAGAGSSDPAGAADGAVTLEPPGIRRCVRRFSTIAHGTRRILGADRGRAPGRAGRVLSARARRPRPRDRLRQGRAARPAARRLAGRRPPRASTATLVPCRRRAAAEAAGGTSARRLSLIETDAPAMLLADRGVTMTIAWGDRRLRRQPVGHDRGAGPRRPVRAARRVRRRVVDPRAMAAGCARSGWSATRWPTASTASRPSASNRAGGGGRGGRHDAEWDAYETAYADAIAIWAVANPDDPDHDEFLARSAMMAESYRDWRRDAFGFAIGRFRKPA